MNNVGWQRSEPNTVPRTFSEGGRPARWNEITPPGLGYAAWSCTNENTRRRQVERPDQRPGRRVRTSSTGNALKEKCYDRNQHHIRWNEVRQRSEDGSPQGNPCDGRQRDRASQRILREDERGRGRSVQ